MVGLAGNTGGVEWREWQVMVGMESMGNGVVWWASLSIGLSSIKTSLFGRCRSSALYLLPEHVPEWYAGHIYNDT